MRIVQEGHIASFRNVLVLLDTVQAVKQVGRRLQFTMSSGATVVAAVEAPDDFHQVAAAVLYHASDARKKGGQS